MSYPTTPKRQCHWGNSRRMDVRLGPFPARRNGLLKSFPEIPSAGQEPAPALAGSMFNSKAFYVGLALLIQRFLLDKDKFARLRCIVTKLVHFIRTEFKRYPSPSVRAEGCRG